jgi:hypothetical protein
MAGQPIHLLSRRDELRPPGGFLDEEANASTEALIYDTSVSLDGFITGPEPGRDYPLGKGGDELHEWMSG